MLCLKKINSFYLFVMPRIIQYVQLLKIVFGTTYTDIHIIVTFEHSIVSCNIFSI